MCILVTRQKRKPVGVFNIIDHHCVPFFALDFLFFRDVTMAFSSAAELPFPAATNAQIFQ